jgi:ABC-type lipoprotein release transport system permease subunit
MSSIFASFLCQAAIVGILFSTNGKPLSAWTALILLNATISILPTVSKSLLLLSVVECISQSKWNHFARPHRMIDFDIFDNASRGPLGAVKLLSKRQILKTMASLGAIVMLLGLAIDPFVQQLLS